MNTSICQTNHFIRKHLSNLFSLNNVLSSLSIKLILSLKVNASDNDKSDTNSNLTYSIFAGDVLNKFAINISTGVISLKDSLDGYGGQTYQLSVKAIDRKYNPMVVKPGRDNTTISLYEVGTQNNKQSKNVISKKHSMKKTHVFFYFFIASGLFLAEMRFWIATCHVDSRIRG